MRIDARSPLDQTPIFQVLLNGIPLDNVVAVDTTERWIVRRLSPEETLRAEARGEVFIPDAPPEETIHIGRSSVLSVHVNEVR